MPQPLPAITVPDNMPTLNAYRTGMQDRIAQDERNLMKEAGGLAAAGNYSGARSALYKGGKFDEARSMSAEIRAIQNHAKSLNDAQLEKQAKVQDAIGRLVPLIKTPEQLEQAKAVLKSRGFDASSVTFDQLPMLRQQALTVQQQLENERAEREAAAVQKRADQAQANADRTFNFQQAESQREQRNSDRSYGLQERQFTQTSAAKLLAERAEQANKDREFTLKQRQTDILQQRADAAKAKASAPKALNEGQASAQSYLGVMEDAQAVLRGDEKQPGVLPNEAAESPMGTTSNFLLMNSPDSVLTSAHLDKKQKEYAQAAMQWVRAKLRKESGATISPEEFAADYRIYFPQPGDSIQVRRNKARARKKVEDGFRIMGGASGNPASGNDLSDLSDDDILRELSK